MFKQRENRIGLSVWGGWMTLYYILDYKIA